MSNSAGETFPTCDCNLCKIATLTAENTRLAERVRVLTDEMNVLKIKFEVFREDAPDEWKTVINYALGDIKDALATEVAATAGE